MRSRFWRILFVATSVAFAVLYGACAAALYFEIAPPYYLLLLFLPVCGLLGLMILIEAGLALLNRRDIGEAGALFHSFCLAVLFALVFFPLDKTMPPWMTGAYITIFVIAAASNAVLLFVLLPYYLRSRD